MEYITFILFSYIILGQTEDNRRFLSEVRSEKKKIKMSKIKSGWSVSLILMGLFGFCLSAEFMEEKGKCLEKITCFFVGKLCENLKVL